MPNNIFEMEVKLQEMQKKYKRLEEQYQTVASEGGVSFTLIELATLNGIKGQIEVLINALKEEIVRQEERINKDMVDLDSLTMQKVINKYQSIYNDMIKFLTKEMDNAYHDWIIHINYVTKLYKKAEQSHKSIVNDMNKHQAAIIQAGNLLLSLMGIKFKALCDSSEDLTVLLKGIKESTSARKGIVKDAWKKAKKMTLEQTTKSSTSIEKVVDDSLSKLLNLNIKLDEYYREIKTHYIAFIDKVLLYQNYVVQLDLQNIGNPLEELTKAYSVEDDMQRIQKNIQKSISQVPITDNYDEVEKDFKRLFWSLWIPKLQTTRVFDEDQLLEDWKLIDQAPIHYNAKNWNWTKKFTDEITELVDLTSLSIGDRGLDKWVSESDAQELIKWAKAFEPKQVF